MATNPNALGGMIPGQPPGLAQPMGAPVMLQPGQMPMQGENFQYAGFPHPDQPGMVPGVPGSMGLNPMQGQQFSQGQGLQQQMHGPSGMFPLNPGMGGPMHGQQGPNMNDWHQNFRNALMDWRQQRPQFGQDGMQAVMDWRQQRPDRQDYRQGMLPQQPAPVALPPQQIMQPMQQPPQPQTPNTYQLPTY